jgi:vancomycin resistance protein YoaR
MDLSRVSSRPPLDALTIALRLLVASLIAALAFFVAIIGFVAVTRLAFLGRTLPGVSVAEAAVGGRPRPEIEALLGQTLTYPQTGRIVLRDGTRVWTAAPAELGAVLDIPSMAGEALSVGRRGSFPQRLNEQLDSWFRGQTLSPILVVDQRGAASYLAELALRIDQPQIEASLSVNGLDVEVQPGQIGRRLDMPAAMAAVSAALSTLHDASIDLPVRETPPQILDVTQQAAVARAILSQPLTLTAEGAGPWVFDAPALAQMMRFNRVSDDQGTRYVVGLDPVVLMDFFAPLAPELERSPENARFIFNDDTRQLDLLQPAVIGRSLDLESTLEAIDAGLASGQHTLALVFDTTPPAVGDTATAAELGITENVLMASYGIQGASTYFYGSSSERIQNITTAAAAFHGLLVAPGETFSMADHLGDISLDNGYAEALIIMGNRTIKGVGGGVCQVSTTLFRAVFFGGYPIVERHPHAYRVGYYEQGTGSPGPGLDATVFVPLVDFKFTNDTPYWLLMETYIYGNQLLWKFYSTSDGRTVEWSSDRSNKVDAPDDLYRENEDLPKGKIVQVDYHADGLDVVVVRTVQRGGETLYQDRIKTHYLPWRAIYEYGPGTELPKGAHKED